MNEIQQEERHVSFDVTTLWIQTDKLYTRSNILALYGLQDIDDLACYIMQQG